MMQAVKLIIFVLVAFNARCAYINDTKITGCTKNGLLSPFMIGKQLQNEYPGISFLCGISLKYYRFSKYIDKYIDKFRERITGIRLKFCSNSNWADQRVRLFQVGKQGEWKNELRCPDGQFINMLQVKHGLSGGVLVGLIDVKILCARPGDPKPNNFYQYQQKQSAVDKISSDYSQSFISAVAVRSSKKQSKIWGLVFNFERFPVVNSLSLNINILPSQSKQNKKVIKIFTKDSSNPLRKRRIQPIKQEKDIIIIMRCNTTHDYLENFSFPKKTSVLKVSGVVKDLSKIYPETIQQISQFRIGGAEVKVQNRVVFTYQNIIAPNTKKTIQIKAQQDQKTFYQLNGQVQIAYGANKVDQKIKKIQFKGNCTGVITQPPYVVSYESKLK